MNNRNTVINLLYAGLCAMALTACTHRPQATTLAEVRPQASSSAASTKAPASTYVPADPHKKFRHHGLTIVGYNYTDYGFYSYQVDGRGGGNLVPSTPTTGGSKSTCCYDFYTPLPADEKVKVKWSRGIRKGIWCEAEVPLKGPLPAKPEYLEVHFYQDGHIELAITEEPSLPRLALERYSNGQRHATGNVLNDDKFAVCRHGY